MNPTHNDYGTDLASLREPTGPPPIPLREAEGRSLADWAVDALIPLMIFCMMLSVTWFLLDIRFVYTERLDLNYRAFAFFFVMGIVALNRLRAERGLADSAVYMVGLVFAVGVFTLVSQSRGGGVAGGYLGGVVLSLCFNLAVVVVLWRVTDRRTRDCCVDASSRYGEEGILRSRWTWRRSLAVEVADTAVPSDDGATGAKRPPRKHPASSLFYLALPILAILAAGQRILPQGGTFLESAGSVYVGTYTASMLMLLLLSSYRGLRVYCQRREINFPTSIAAFWLGLGTVMVALVFVLGLWGPVPVTAPPGGKVARTYDSTGRTLSDRRDYHEHEREGESGSQRASREANPDGNGNDGAGPGDESGGTESGGDQGTEGGGEAGGEERDGVQSSEDGSQTNNDEGAGDTERQGAGTEESSTSPREDAVRSGTEDGSGASAKSASTPRAEVPMNALMESFPGLKWLGYGALALVGLFVLYMLLQAAAHFFGQASRRPSRFARWFERLSRLFRRLTYVPKRKPRRARVKIDRDIATCAHFQNPLDGPLPLREKIQYSYDALCALAYDLGVPREEDQTPFEFLAQLPEPIAAIRNEAHVLTHLYVAGSYSALNVPESVLDDLRAFWKRFERMRSKIVR